MRRPWTRSVCSSFAAFKPERERPPTPVRGVLRTRSADPPARRARPARTSPERVTSSDPDSARSRRGDRRQRNRDEREDDVRVEAETEDRQHRPAQRAAEEDDDDLQEVRDEERRHGGEEADAAEERSAPPGAMSGQRDRRAEQEP